eukprot:TRINITY_DN94678_c0_g1_i1.p1 TRINITY_DN94678_c0_g1~~TRINITY_DN94678_c0_g1_i1.p1  ORF type:complete len:260 (+),score=68.97 TRINITY_DN94678_c0_g1_i1:30-782(+)
MAEPSRPWVRPGGTAILQGLKSKPELNGQEVSIQAREPSSGRWRCKVAPFGEEMKFKAENLAKPPEQPEQSTDEWLRRGVQAAVSGHPDLEGQIVRVVTVESNGQCKCVVRATNEAVTVSKDKLRQLAGAAATAKAPEPEEAPKPAATPGRDWAAMELERRRLAEGFRSGFDEGASVLLQNLQSMPELNGKLGKLVSWDSQSLRWKVEIEGSAGVKSLRPQNLVPQVGMKRKQESEAQDAAEPDEKRQCP